MQVASQHKAATQLEDNEDDPGLVHRALSALNHGLSFLSSHSFSGRTVEAQRQAADTGRTRIPGAVQQPPRQLGAGLMLNPVEAGHAMNAGLQEAQHQYRALRDIKQRHGLAAALGEGALVAVAGTGGALLDGAPGAALAAEATAGVTERTFFKDSWDRTTDGDGYLDASGRHVSPGRDLANLSPFKYGSLPYNALSGIFDSAFDMAADPVAAAGGVVHGYNATEKAAGGVVGRIRGDTVIRGPNSIDDIVARRPSFLKVAADVARKRAAEVQRDYPAFALLARDLGEASTTDEVLQVFRDAADHGEMLGETLPLLVRHPGRISSEPLTAEADDVASRLAMFRRRFTSKLPYRYNADEGTFAHVDIDPSSNSESNLNAVRNLLHMGGLSERAIDGVMQDYLTAGEVGTIDASVRRTVLRNAIPRMFIAQVAREDLGNDLDAINSIAAKLKVDVTAQMGGTGGMEGAEYAYNTEGHSLSGIRTEQGASTTAAIYQGQRGDFKIPQYAAWVRTAREQAGGVRALYGKVDDFAFHYITIPFKGLALATGGFAFRVGGIAEGVPAAFREGVVNLARSAVTAREARLAVRSVTRNVADEEVDNIVAAALNQMHDGVHVVQNPRLAKNAVELAVAHDGHVTPPALRPGHYDTDPAVPLVARDQVNLYKITRQQKTRETDMFGGYRNESPDQPKYWNYALREASRDEGARIHAKAYANTYRATRDVDDATRAAVRADVEWLRAPEQKPFLSDMLRSKVPTQPGEDPLVSFARTRVEATKGLTHAPHVEGAVPHLDLLDDLAAGKVRSIDKLKEIELVDRPIAVKGRIIAPDVGGSLVERAVNFGFRKMVDPIVNGLGRNHQFLLEYTRVRSAFDQAVADGVLSNDEALQKASEIAVKRVARFIHNPYERTQFSTLARNYMPFYFAQEQSYRRLGRLLINDPAAFRRYQLANMAFTDWVHHEKDEQGNTYAHIPFLGVLNESTITGLAHLGIHVAAAAPIAVLGNTASLDTVLPFTELNAEGARPSFSPFVTVPSKMLTYLVPETKDVVRGAIGDVAMSNSIWQQTIPNPLLRNGMRQLDGQTIDSTAIAVAASLFHRQDVAMAKWIGAGHDATDKGAPHIVPNANASPHEQKEFRERIHNEARIILGFRALISEVSPLAPSMSVGDYSLKTELNTSIRKHGVIDGLNRYLAKHPTATAYTVFPTQNTGVEIQPYHKAQKFYDDHPELFAKYPNAAAYLIPQDKKGEFDSAVFQEQLALGLRERKAPKEFIDDLYEAEGFAQYDADRKIYDKALADVGDDDESKAVLRQRWSDYLQNTLRTENPVWWNRFTSEEGKTRRDAQLKDLRVMLTDKTVPNTSLRRGIRGLVADLDTHLAYLNDGKLDGWSREERQQAVDNWLAYLDRQAEEQPELSMIIGRLLRHYGNR